MTPEFASLFAQHVGNAFAKQLAFGDLLGERNWRLDIQAGRARFGDDLAFDIQLLGSEAEEDASWLWSWANHQSNLPPEVLTAGHSLREMGEAGGIEEFTVPYFSLDVANGHMLAMVASGLNPDCCYYRGPYDGGAIFFLICGAPPEVTRHVAPERAVTVLNEIISQFEIAHRPMAESFLTGQGFSLTMEGRTLTAKRGQQSIVLSFDSYQRIAQIEATLTSPATPSGKSWWQFWK